jgi:Carboxypeptidase regulatory-like domain
VNCPGRLFPAAMLLALLGPWPAMPQASAVVQISGTVLDPNGGAVAGAQVKATQTATGLVREVPTGPDGAYIEFTTDRAVSLKCRSQWI